MAAISSCGELFEFETDKPMPDECVKPVFISAHFLISYVNLL